MVQVEACPGLDGYCRIHQCWSQVGQEDSFYKQVMVRIKVSKASRALRDDHTMRGPLPSRISEETHHLVMSARWLESKMLANKCWLRGLCSPMSNVPLVRWSLRGREESSASVVPTTWHREAQGGCGLRKGSHGDDHIIEDVSRSIITMFAQMDLLLLVSPFLWVLFCSVDWCCESALWNWSLDGICSVLVFWLYVVYFVFCLCTHQINKN